jgi:hypothetical protein
MNIEMMPKPVVTVGDIWHTPAVEVDNTEYYELILEELDGGRYAVLDLFTGVAYEVDLMLFYDAVKVA